MRRRWKAVLVAAAGVAAAAVLMLVVNGSALGLIKHALGLERQPEPSYKGRALTEWLQMAHEHSVMFSNDGRLYHGYMADYLRVREAIQMIGTNALPRLVELMRPQTPNPLRQRLKGVVLELPNPIGGPKSAVSSFVADRAENGPALAYEGFFALGDAAAPAIPQLIEVLNTNSPYATKLYVIWVLSGLDRSEQAPAALRALGAVLATNPDQSLRACAARGISNFRPELSVPVLQPGLVDRHASIRSAATNALLKMGPSVLTNAAPR
jgi:hypothetical protein